MSGFFNAYREGERVTRKKLREIAQQYQNWVKNRSEKWGAPIVDAPAGRRDDFVDSYFRRAKPDQVVVLRRLAEPTVQANGKRIPGLKLDQPPQLALMHALVRFAHIAAGNTFQTADLYPHVLETLHLTPDKYTLA